MNVSAAACLQPEDRLAALERVFQSAPVGLCLIDLDYRYVMVNDAFARMYSLPVGHFAGHTVQEALPAVAEQVLANLSESAATRAMVESEITLDRVLADGGTQQLVFLRSAQPLMNQDGAITGFSVGLSDITERKRMEAALRESEADYRYTVDLNPHIPWTTDADGKSLYASWRYLGLIGLTPEQARSHEWIDKVHPDQKEASWREWCQSLTTGNAYDVIYQVETANGEWRWMRARAFPRRAETGQILRWYGTLEDIHERKMVDEALRVKTARLEEATAQLALLAREDHLTGLANRRHFDDSLTQELARAARSAQPLALLMIDVDHFKRFNDAYGHLAGDQALRSVGGVLRQVLRRRGDLAARYGGEEFVLLLPDTGETGAMEVARHALSAVRALGIQHAEAATTILTISVGLAVFDASGGWTKAIEGRDLIQAADFALYSAKHAGRDRVVSAVERQANHEISLAS